MERPHLERLHGRRADLVRKLELTSLAMQKRNEGQSLSREEKSLIDSKADTTLLLGEYKEIFEHLNNNVTNNNMPGMSASLPDDLRSLVSLLYFGSLFQVLDEEAVAECDSHIRKERGKINKDEHDLSGITEVVQKIVPHLESGCLGHHLELVNSCYASFVEKSEEPEIRELVHMLVTSDQFCTRKGFHQKD